MNKTYTVGRSADALIRIPKQHDTVGKLHLEIEDLGKGWVRVTDLNSTNGTFLRIAGKWKELDSPQAVSIDAELMLGSHVTTPRLLLSCVTAPAPSGNPPKTGPAAREPLPPQTPPRKSSGMRRNEFGEIVPE